MVALLLAIAACGDGPAPAAPALPEHITAAIKDPRIGSGIPAQYRFAGVEHNRLTLVTLRELRSESRNYRDEAIRCAGIMRIGKLQAPRSAAAAGIPEHLPVLQDAMAAAMADLAGCATSGTGRTASITGDTGIRAVDGDGTYISDAAFSTMNAFVERLDAATSVDDVWASITQLAAEARSFGGVEADAILALVAQSQGSFVLWEPGGAGWSELGTPGEYLSVLRSPFRRNGFDDFLKAMKADAIGCIAAIGFMRAMPIIHDPRLLIGACGIAAASATIYAGYKIVTAYK
jgi:hypothetical protein